MEKAIKIIEQGATDERALMQRDLDLALESSRDMMKRRDHWKAIAESYSNLTPEQVKEAVSLLRVICLAKPKDLDWVVVKDRIEHILETIKPEQG